MGELFNLINMQKCKYKLHDKIWYIKYDPELYKDSVDSKSVIFPGYINCIIYNANERKFIYYISEEDAPPYYDYIIIDDERLISKDYTTILNTATLIRLQNTYNRDKAIYDRQNKVEVMHVILNTLKPKK